mgnify:FL=1
MYLIKLNATSSTNDFLKQLSVKQSLSNFTVVWADVQTNGRGQMGAEWVTESSKNLTFSVLLNSLNLQIPDLFTLNVMITNAVSKALESYNLTNIWVKWPNDILSYNKKVAGILVENNIKADGSIQSVIGIGINLNQTNFELFPQGSSILNQYQRVLDKEDLLKKIVDLLETTIESFDKDVAWAYFHKKLFRKDKVSAFEDANGTKFSGIIKGVNHHGQLEVQLENDDLQCFNLKEIKLLY